jgi:putative chitinase
LEPTVHPITNFLLLNMSPKARSAICDPVSAAMTDLFPKYEITSRLRIAHFLAQACYETDGWSTLVEYASGEAYEDREDLGNTHKGDGPRYRGRGIFMYTGRANYAEAAKRFHQPLVQQPELAALPPLCVEMACFFWVSRGLNEIADGGANGEVVRTVTRKIQGGSGGLAARQRYFSEVYEQLSIFE